MNDTLLNALRSDPPAQFSEGLRARLRSEEAPERPEVHLLSKMLPVAAAIVVVAALFAVPAVRASAASLLALFRVVNFVAVPVEPKRFDALTGDTVRREKPDWRERAGLAGLRPARGHGVRRAGRRRRGYGGAPAAWLPADAQIIEIAVTGELVVRVIANPTRLEEVLEALGIDDVQVPAGLNGKSVTIRVPPVVMVRFEHGGRRTRFLQARSPEVTLPADVDLAALGEIGLRILGLSADDARHFAGAIDWSDAR